MAEPRNPGRYLAPALVACAVAAAPQAAELTIDRLFDAPALAGTHVTREEHTIIVTLRPGLDWRRGTPPPLADLARLLSGLDNRIEVLAHGGIDRSPHAAAVADWPIWRAMRRRCRSTS